MTWFVSDAETRCDDATIERAQRFTAARGGKPPVPRNNLTDIKIGVVAGLTYSGLSYLCLRFIAPYPHGTADIVGVVLVAAFFTGLTIAGERDRYNADKWTYSRDDLRAARVGLGPLWQGRDYHLNPFYAHRNRAIIGGLWTLGLAALALWGFVSGPHGMVPKFGVEMLLLFALFLGVPALAFAWIMGDYQYLEADRWTLDIRDGRLHFQSESKWSPLITRKGSWSVALDNVSRVETGSRVDWEPTRQSLVGKKPTPREEMQTFLFIADGSRRVVATMHGGRESLLTLAQSIRSVLPVLREHRDRTVGAELAIASGEGFNI